MLAPKKHVFDFRNRTNVNYNKNGFDCVYEIPHFSDVTFLEIEKVNFFFMGQPTTQGVDDYFAFRIQGLGTNVNGALVAPVGTAYSSNFAIYLDTTNTLVGSQDFYTLDDIISQLNSKIKAKLLYDALQAASTSTVYEKVPSAIYLKRFNDTVELIIEYPITYSVNTYTSFYDFNINFNQDFASGGYSTLNTLLGLANVLDPILSNTSIQTLNNTTLIEVNQYPANLPQSYAKPVREYSINSIVLTKGNRMGGKIPTALLSVAIPVDASYGSFIEFEKKLLFTWDNFQGTNIDFFITDEKGNKVKTVGDSGISRFGLTVYCKFYSTSETLLLNS
jgi:hypothetical protein